MKKSVNEIERIPNYSLKKIFLLLLSILVVVTIIFISVKYIQTKSYESEKLWQDKTPYFDVNLSTSYRAEDLADIIEGHGQIHYKLYLKGYLDKYKYDKYDTDDRITISFLDKSGFLITDQVFWFKYCHRIVDEGKVIGFKWLGNFYGRFSDYKNPSSISVAWTCDFQSK